MKRNMGITVNELLRFCEQQVKKGNGGKHILISRDDEGNGYHDLWYQFDPNIEGYSDVIYDNYVLENKDEFIILG